MCLVFTYFVQALDCQGNMMSRDWALEDAYSTQGNMFYAPYTIYRDHSYFNNPGASLVVISHTLIHVDDTCLRSFGFKKWNAELKTSGLKVSSPTCLAVDCVLYVWISSDTLW